VTSTLLLSAPSPPPDPRRRRRHHHSRVHFSSRGATSAEGRAARSRAADRFAISVTAAKGNSPLRSFDERAATFEIAPLSEARPR
jgi:hypothetical protein